MNDYQELLNKLKQELVELEKKFEIVKKEKEECHKRYQEVKDKTVLLNDKLDELSDLRDNLPHSNDFKISVFVGIMSILCLLISLVLSGYIYVLLYKQLYSVLMLSDYITSLYCFFATVLGCCLIGTLVIKMFKKIQILLEKRSFMKIIDSDEYKQLLIKIENIEKEREKELHNLCVPQKEFFDISTEYNTLEASISMKRTLINYLEDEINPKAELEDSKSFVRRRTKNN